MPANLTAIDPQEARKLMDEGALVVDVREPHELSGGYIPGSRNVALSTWESAELGAAEGQAVVFLCASGNRTTVYGPALAERVGTSAAYHVRGGMFAWQRSGLPTERPAASSAPAGGLFGRLFAG